MVFTSLQYVFFFPFVFITYYLLPYNKRNFFLLICSCYFYAVFIPKYIFLILFLIIIDYLSGILIEDGSSLFKKLYLSISLISNFSVLIFFKYFNFIALNIEYIFNYFGLNIKIYNNHYPLPLGLSFFIFQSLSYTFDVYYGKIKAERTLWVYALYVMYFPQLVAGPIERSTNLLPQFRKKKIFNYRRAIDGLRLILWGFFQKLVIADRISVYVNSAYNSPSSSDGISLIFATIFFSFQIFFDFSAYSTIAIGTARVLGFNLMRNFRSPYFSKSLTEFWRYWHISLSTWFRDYVYFPIGGNKISNVKWITLIIFIFIISGIWHGANWTFMLWGLFHGVLLILEKFSPSIPLKTDSANNLTFNVLKLLRISRTFILVCIGWIFFRSQTIGDAIVIFSKIKSVLINLDLANVHLFLNSIPTSHPEFILALIISLSGLAIDLFSTKINQLINKQCILVRWSIYYAVIFFFISFASFHSNDFIYFQF